MGGGVYKKYHFSYSNPCFFTPRIKTKYFIDTLIRKIGVIAQINIKLTNNMKNKGGNNAKNL